MARSAVLAVSGELSTPDEQAAEIEALDAARHVGPRDLSSFDHPFSPRELARLDEALTLAARETEMLFSVYVGEVDGGRRDAAEKLISKVDPPESGAVLLVVSPGQRVLHIITTPAAALRVPNRSCALAALGMRAAFAGGDLTGGIVTGLRMLADAAGSPPRSA